ncbi:hypothetical protein [Thermoplasma volcanium GSS1]|uniref:Uncharacterized protein n=1 Tax=Thermoplasma volcanium (strain ATCC 51530 / DSM 4299 / JCM 9571 / NBRC 15438 / GSS1) TaxID=273116 RepID=Q97AG8_THEVO|nr:NRAMP family divalent metal transporter [Thermoplasma volcanium]BAB59984.1 hypothetical protein [Thermoplasma volcanium GSS1]
MDINIGTTHKVFHVLSKIGPAWIVMMADVDVASIITGLQSGAEFGFHMIFVMLILIPPLFIVQNAAGYLGIYSGMGVGEAIRQRYGRRLALLAAIPMASTDILSYIAEYSGIAIGLYMVGVSPYISVPVVFVIHNLIVLMRRYGRIESILMIVSVGLVLFIIVSVALMKPSWHSVILTGLNPIQPYGNHDFDIMIIANLGAIIMPFMIFYQAGASVQKSLLDQDIKISRNETAIGSIVSEVLMVMIVIAGTFIGGYATEPKMLAAALLPFGTYAYYITAAGFVTAGFLALIVISLASSWGIAEALGWKLYSGRRRGMHKAQMKGLTEERSDCDRRKFIYLYMGESIPAAAIALSFSAYLLPLVIDLMIVFVLVLAPVGVLLGLLVSDQKIMNGHRLSKRYMALFWFTLAIIEIAGLYSIITSI